jgi:catechol 2,3-dioxygenase
MPVLTRFYEQIIGLKVAHHKANKTQLSANGQLPALLVLEQDESAPRQDPRQPGLFHAAYLVPNRLELARWFRHIQQTGCPLQGLGDHLVSEAIYLADPDGNGIEIYADRPRATWPYLNGEIQMTTVPVDVDSLLQELPASDEPWAGLHPATKLGHLHLQVSNLASAADFYHHILGFPITQQSFPGALFLATGGYHHHLGLNTWRSRNAPPRAPAATGLASFLILVPDSSILAAIQKRLENAQIYPVATTADYLELHDTDNIRMAIQFRR